MDGNHSCNSSGEKVATCLVCGNEMAETIPATGHSYSDEWTVVQEATCTEDGIETNSCLVCGKTVEQAIASGHIYENGVCQRCGNRLFTYRVLADGTAEITGFTGGVQEVIIPETIDGYTVTSIGEYAFSFSENMICVSIPKSIVNIGKGAFKGCFIESFDVDAQNSHFAVDSYDVLFNKEKTELIQYPVGNQRTSYTVPEGVLSISDGAFAYGISLREVILPNGLQTIVANAFYSCAYLVEITIPDSVTTIGDSAFAYCYSLATVTLGSGISAIGNNMFLSCMSLEKIEIPDNVTTIGDNAFHSCQLLIK